MDLIFLGNERYGEFHVEPEKFDYIRDTIFFYESGHALVKCNQLFLNGELLFNSKDLKEKCDEIGQPFNRLDSDPHKLIDYLKNNYSKFNSYTCDTYSAYNVRKDDING